MSTEYGNSTRLRFSELKTMPSIKDAENMKQQAWIALIRDMLTTLNNYKVHNPEVYLWDRHEENKDIVIGWYIGNGESKDKRIRDEKMNIIALMKIQTHEYQRTVSFMENFKKKFLGQEIDVRKLNPY
jgi:hypothetical protein